ncbi:hypothetical protein [Phormidesmis priestleyi]
MVKLPSQVEQNVAKRRVSLEERLKQHPDLRAKIERLLGVVENAQGELKTAHEAEQRVIEEIQKLGQAALQGWASRENEQQTQQWSEQQPKAHRNRKKNSTGTADLGRSV